MKNSILDSRFRGVGIAILLLISLLFYYAVLYSFSSAAPSVVDCNDSTHVVTNETDWNDAITCFNDETTPGTVVISMTTDVTLTGDSQAITNSLPTVGLVIDGADFEINGDSNFHPISVGVDANVVINDLTIVDGNASVDGGGIYNAGALTINNSQILSNTADDDGGGIYVHLTGTLTLDNVIVADNTATDDGGGIQFAGTDNLSTIQNSSILRNQAANESGGIGTLAPLTIDSTTIDGNTAGRNGGGIFNQITQITVTNSAINNNTANAQAGGGIHVNGAATLNLSGTTLSGNNAGTTGAALNLTAASNNELENVTISANGTGTGAINSAGTTSIAHATVVNNTGTNGVSNTGSLTLENSILANNSGADCISTAGTVGASGTENLIENDDGADGCGVATVTVDPNLAALADNGGIGQTHAPNNGSPVLNAATSQCASTDQRGVSRSATCELGAIEVVEISVSSTTALEGTGADGVASFTLSRTDSAIPMTVTVNTSDDSALSASDYTALVGEEVIIPAGSLTSTFGVTLTGDTGVEPDEVFTVTLSNPQGAVLANTTVTGTIENDDTATITLSAPSIDEGAGGATTSMIFTATLDVAVEGGLTIDISAADGTATTADGDYTAASETLTFAGTANEEELYTITLTDDSDTEQDETIIATFGSITATLSNSISTSGSPATGTILNDDDADFTLEVGSSDVSEADTTIPVTVTLSNAATFTATVDYTTVDGSATAGSDYTAASGTLSFGIGETVQTFDVAILDDGSDENDETFDIELSNQTSGLTLGTPSTATVRIEDNDGQPTVSFAETAYSVSEDAGTLDVIFELSNVSGNTVTATIQSADNSATAGSDYTAINTVVSIPANSLTHTLSISITDDAIYEGGDLQNEKFSVFIADAGNAEVSSTNALSVIDIVENELAPAVSISDVIIAEDAVGGKAVFTITLSSIPTSTVDTTINYTTIDGTATDADNDYDAVTSAVTIMAGDTSATVEVTINNDSKGESNETFFLELTGVVDGTLGATTAERQGQATITNDDSNSVYLPVIVR